MFRRAYTAFKEGAADFAGEAAGHTLVKSEWIHCAWLEALVGEYRLRPRPGGVYIVHVKRYSVAQARTQFSHLLDAAEAGDVVVIERRGKRFRLETDRGGKRRAGRRAAARPSIIDHVDPTVLEGQWTWEWAAGGLRFTARRKRR